MSDQPRGVDAMRGGESQKSVGRKVVFHAGGGLRVVVEVGCRWTWGGILVLVARS